MTSFPPAPESDGIVAGLQAAGLDTSGFSAAAVGRAVAARASATGSGARGYRRLIERDPSELARLGHEVIVRYTDFFRDPHEWRALGEHLASDVRKARPLVVWSAGCASGQEAYTAAIVIAEVCRSRRALHGYVRVLATDIDDDALAQARSGKYTPDEMSAVPPRLRRRYFRRIDGGFEVRADVADVVSFEHRDLSRDPPPRPVDLIVCRHTLMYFGSESQREILSVFHAALRPGGRLFLESTDALPGHSDAFLRSAGGHPIFVKAATNSPPARREGPG